MARSRGSRAMNNRKTKGSKPQVPARKAAPLQAETQPSHRPLTIQRIKDHPMIAALGLIMLVSGFVQLVATPFSAPEIHATASDPVSPFVFPFALKNSSKLTPLGDVKWTCLVRHMEAGRGWTLDNIGVQSGQQFAIGAGDVSNHICNVMNPGVPIHKLTMDVTVQYTMLHFWQRSFKQPFTWISDGQHSRWIEGDVR